MFVNFFKVVSAHKSFRERGISAQNVRNHIFWAKFFFMKKWVAYEDILLTTYSQHGVSMFLTDHLFYFIKFIIYIYTFISGCDVNSTIFPCWRIWCMTHYLYKMLITFFFRIWWTSIFLSGYWPIKYDLI